MKLPRPLWSVITLLGVIGTGLGIWALVVVTASSPLESDTAPAPVVVHVQRDDVSPTVSQTLEVVSRPGPELILRGGGTITSWSVELGASLESGETLLTLDDTPVVLMAASAPLHRDLGPGDTGPDVARLVQFLAQGGADVEGDTMTEEVVAAVEEWNTAHGRQGQTFGVASVVWIPHEPATSLVERVVAVGAITTPGQTVARTPDVVERIDARPRTALAEGPLTLRAAGEEAALDREAWAVTDPEEAQRIAQALPRTEGVGEIRARDPQPALVVPSASVVTDATGATCVVAMPGRRIVRVDAVDSDAGGTRLPADTDLDAVLVNARRLMPGLSCTSR